VTQTREDLKRLLVSLLPAGSEDLYALANTDAIGGTLWALAGALRDTTTSRFEQLRREICPSTVEENLPEWEQVCGLTYTPIAQFGTIPQRVNAVLAILRLSDGFTLDKIRAVVQPYLVYADPSQIEILETDRAALTAKHVYLGAPAPVTVAMGVFGESFAVVPDDPRVSPAGASVFVSLTTTRPDRVTFVLENPGGLHKVVLGNLDPNPTSVSAQAYQLWAPSFAGKAINGRWRLRFACTAAAMTVVSWGLFVEGLGATYSNTVPPRRTGDGLGAAMFEFAVVVDPLLLGVGADLPGAQLAIQRWKPDHTRGYLAQRSTITGDVCAIPDTVNAIPNQAIPC
jgi:hypothetical protein